MPPPVLPRIYRVAGAALLGSATLFVAVPAVAVPTCSFDAPTGALTVVVGTGETAVIARSGDAITLNGAACDSATVTTTDSIAVDGSAGGANVTIDLSGGPFEPGMTPEANGTSEIEFTLTVPGASTVLLAGGAQADHIVLGADGANLNAAETAGDADVAIVGTPAVTLQGNAGADTLSVAGDAGTGAPSAASVAGGADDDDLVGGLGGSAFDGGDGVDSVDYGAAAGILADLAGGVVLHTAGGQDTITNVEDLLGSPAADVIVGTEQANALAGADGDDRIEGGGGDDALDGGAGVDTVRFRAAVVVDLQDGTATGDGNDSVTAFENVMGSKKADTIHGDDGRNKLAGGSGADELFGHGGADLVTGGKGNDRLNGQDGPDALFGRAGRDQLDGGRANDSCNGGPDPDSFVHCERIVLD